MKAIIVDIDGTIADFTHRLALMRAEAPSGVFTESQKASINDPSYPWCVNLVLTYHNAGYQIIFLTARSERYRESTIEWLTANIDPSISYILHMRPNYDERSDELVKMDVYYELIEPLYDVELALDDRDKVVAMWRDDVGIPCLQVQRGKY